MKTCLHCGAKLSPLNRNLLLCRPCAQADEQQIDNYFGESEAQTPLIYLSYRWSDAGALSDLIYHRLVERFGPSTVVRDIDRLALGVPLPRLVDRMMRRAVAVLIVIGPDWLASQDATGQPRLDDPNDLVRREVDTALRLSAPVIVLNATGQEFPPEDLPPWLTALSNKRCIDLSQDPESDEGLDVLLAKLAAMLGTPVTCEVQLSPEDALENGLLRLEHAWERKREDFVGPWGRPPSAMHLLTVCLFGLVALTSGVQGLLTAQLPDPLCLALIAIGVVWPLYRLAKYIQFRRADRAHLAEKARMQSALQATRSQAQNDSAKEALPAAVATDANE